MPFGIGDEIRKVLQSTLDGRAYLDAFPSGVNRVTRLINTAEAYAYDDWSRSNAREIHVLFRALPNRLELLQRIWTDATAREQRRLQTNDQPGTEQNPFRLRGRAVGLYNEGMSMLARLDRAGLLWKLLDDYQDQMRKAA